MHRALRLAQGRLDRTQVQESSGAEALVGVFDLLDDWDLGDDDIEL